MWPSEARTERVHMTLPNDNNQPKIPCGSARKWLTISTSSGISFSSNTRWKFISSGSLADLSWTFTVPQHRRLSKLMDPGIMNIVAWQKRGTFLVFVISGLGGFTVFQPGYREEFSLCVRINGHCYSNSAVRPSQSPAVTALPKGEPRVQLLKNPKWEPRVFASTQETEHINADTLR